MTALMTDKEFADFLKLRKFGYITVQKWARAGKLKGVAVRVGDQWRFPLDKVQRWLDQGGMRNAH